MNWFNRHKRTFSILILLPLIWIFCEGPSYAKAYESQQKILDGYREAIKETNRKWNELKDKKKQEKETLRSLREAQKKQDAPRHASPSDYKKADNHKRSDYWIKPFNQSLPVAPATRNRGISTRNLLDLISSIFISEAYAEPLPPPDEDLNETADTRFTRAITDQAAGLGNDAVKIYNWVRNNINYAPTYGSIFGADTCLKRKTCNAFDTASLLIALYRVSGIPARYVRGNVRIP